jgi:serine/threonine protein kinase
MGVATREAYGQALVELGQANPNVVVHDADLAKSTFSAKFQKVFPDRFFTVGIAEANMVSIAAGLALAGKLPFSGESTMDVLLAHATQEPPKFADVGAQDCVPPSIEAVVLSCLAKLPQDRPSSARDLSERSSPTSRS